MNTQKIKVLVAPNSFKECADSIEITTLIRASFDYLIPQKVKSKIDLTYKPIADGGDGFLEVCKYQFGLETLHFEVSRPFNEEKFFVQVGYSPETKTIYIESAEVLGLKTIPEEYRHPLELSSIGIGELILQLIEYVESGFLDIQHVIIGIGGTGTNDLGIGMMEVFGLELYDKYDKQLAVLPKNFSLVEKVVVPEVTLPFTLKAIADVQNPLVGKKGATRIFAEQKGASKEEVDLLEKGFLNILKQMEVEESEIEQLSGAGGGLAAGLKLFFNAEQTHASNFILNDLLNVDKDNNFDIVITGEGKFDSQSLLKKGSMIIASEFLTKEIPIYFICGITEGDLPEEDNLHIIELSEYFDSIEESMQNIEKGIDLACQRIAKDIINSASNKK